MLKIIANMMPKLLNENNNMVYFNKIEPKFHMKNIR